MLAEQLLQNKTLVKIGSEFGMKPSQDDDSLAHQSTLMKTIYSKGSLGLIQEQLPKSRFDSNLVFKRSDYISPKAATLKPTAKGSSQTSSVGSLEPVKGVVQPRRSLEGPTPLGELPESRAKVGVRHSSLEPSTTTLPKVAAPKMRTKLS